MYDVCVIEGVFLRYLDIFFMVWVIVCLWVVGDDVMLVDIVSVMVVSIVLC